MQPSLTMNAIIALTGPNKKYLLPMLILIIISSLFDAVSIALFIPLIAGILGSKDYVGEDSFLNDLTNYIVAFSPNEESKIAILCIFILFVFILKNIFVFMRVVLGTQLSNKLRAYWSAEILETLIKSNIKNIVLEKQGSLINNIINEPIVSSKYIFLVISMSSKVLVTSVLLLIMLSLSWQITSIILITSLLLFSSYLFLIDSKVKLLGRIRLKLVQQITSAAQENLNAIRQVKLFSIESEIVKKFNEKYKELINSLLRVAIYRNITLPIAEVGIIICLVLMLIYINYFTSINLESYVPLLAFILISSQKIALNLAGFASEKVALSAQKPSVIAIHNIITSDFMKNEDNQSYKNIDHLDGDIIFKNVSFKYNKSQDNQTLDSVNLVIKKGQITSISGSSGSGKTTIIDLICGFFKDYEGSISYGTSNLSKLNLSSLRNNIAYISQDSFLFDLSIKDNILIGNKHLSNNEISFFCKKANADKFIEDLPEKYETKLVDRGQNISGGQRQRITIARALARDYEVLIIDEGLSALDSNTVKPIINHLLELRDQGKTIIIVSHNKDYLGISDQTIFIDSGKIQ